MKGRARAGLAPSQPTALTHFLQASCTGTGGPALCRVGSGSSRQSAGLRGLRFDWSGWAVTLAEAALNSDYG